MSLLRSNMIDCVMLHDTTTEDGEGGRHTVWREGERFKAAIAFSGSPESTAAEHRDARSQFNIITDKAFDLNYHDVFRRMSDGKTYRVTGDSNAAPNGAGLELRTVTAEEWGLTE